MNNNMKRNILLSFILAVVPLLMMAQKNPYVITDKGAWCWFADPRALHYESKDGSINCTYVGYIDVHGNVKAMQYDFNTKEKTEVLVRSYFQPDDHNNPTFLVLPDERVMIFYSRHTDEPCFYYRVSSEKGDITTLGEEKRLATNHNTTYPSAFVLTDDPEHIYLCWRGINWHPTIAQLSIPDAQGDMQFTWGPYQMVKSTGARPYAKYQSNGKDKILLAYTTGHPDNEMPNHLYFNYININDLTLEDVAGNKLADIAKGPHRVNKSKDYQEKYPLAVVDAPQDARDWLWQTTSDSKGFPSIAMVRINDDKTSHHYYLARWNGKEWKKIFVADGGGHFHQTPNLEKCYSGGMAINPEKSNVVYCSVPVDGRYEIVEYTIGMDKVKRSRAITKASLKNNARPYVIAGSPLQLVWMNGDYYDWIVSKERPGYPTGIMAKQPFKVKASKKQLLWRHEVELKPVDGVYPQVIFDAEGIKVTVDAETLKPVVSIAGKNYVSTNRLATADSWLRQQRSTNGKWYAPELFASVKYTVECDGKRIRTYINGMLDQNILF